MSGAGQSADGSAGAELHIVGMSGEGKYVKRLGHKRWGRQAVR